MPVTPTYPGVYIEEIPSGVRTITGVATSITAFLGRTLWGPVNEPTLINSFGDFERQFGGVWGEFPMTYAVKDFYANGGSQALIVRLLGTVPAPPPAPPAPAPAPGPAPAPAPAAPTAAAKATYSQGNLNLEANSEGKWGNNLYVGVDHVGITADVAVRFNLPQADLFNLTIAEYLTDKDRNAKKPNRVEKFVNLSYQANGGARRIDRVLAEESNLVHVPLDAQGNRGCRGPARPTRTPRRRPGSPTCPPILRWASISRPGRTARSSSPLTSSEIPET